MYIRLVNFASLIFPWNKFNAVSSLSIPTRYPSEIVANSIVGTPVPHPTSKMRGFLSLGINLNAFLVYLFKFFRKWSFSVLYKLEFDR